MKCIVILLTLLLSGYGFAMDRQPAPLTIINDHEHSVTVRYEPRKEETRVVIPTGEWSCHVHRTIDPKKTLKLPPLLTPFVSIAIDGFQPLQNLPIVKTHIPMVISAKSSGEIIVTQDTQILAVIKALINPGTVQQKKEDEGFCTQQ